MPFKLEVLAIAAIACLGYLCPASVKCAHAAEESAHPSVDESAGQLGLNVFGFSLHTNRSEGYNEFNPGVGLRYAFWNPAPRWTVFGDTSAYYDSRRHWAKYVALGASYRLADAWTLGAAVAYGQSQSYNHGKPFFAPVPGVAFEHGRIVFNLVLLPSETASSKLAGVAFFVTLPLGHLH